MFKLRNNNNYEIKAVLDTKIYINNTIDELQDLYQETFQKNYI